MYMNNAWIILPRGGYDRMPSDDRSRYGLIVTRDKELNFFIHKNRITGLRGWVTLDELTKILAQHDTEGGV